VDDVLSSPLFWLFAVPVFVVAIVLGVRDGIKHGPDIVAALNRLGDERHCYYCKEPVQIGATKCPHCQSDI